MAEAHGTPSAIYYFDANYLTPKYDYYVDDEYRIEGHTDEVPEVPATPEFNYQYLNIDLMLTRGGE